jgi:hypothetical protein
MCPELDPASDEWMIAQGFHEMTPEESLEYSKFFASSTPEEQKYILDAAMKIVHHIDGEEKISRKSSQESA